jgi:large subunit ribosomal protein L15
MPLQRRVPKFGFKNNDKVVFKPVNLDVLQALSEKVADITPEVLVAHGIVGKNDKVKILGRGELKARLTVQAHAFSETARQAIEQAGGSITRIA